ncbi:hypothetical protein LTR91_014256 [Friedmanniomyces endolithicus]|uniref:PQ-loop-domain-containing protein n=1 Tax=Friedmanniomyces endolithicus TaxID=329885 RepID=A0AAN6QN92_9PEZI|nr:hypothetical protein LTR57_002652 [Friedmanniomyces endolithicus]KAK0974796.1 hypothetical protein LTR91_014256 [Friedmanniomyces endolithicus]KAK0993522.1 hypothetical protein LTS01_007465 [Friedmanniomyces endolithicus]KAK1051198.1 hypothetical protein LTS16_002663 [Friedmanniomyces endolithicus]
MVFPSQGSVLDIEALSGISGSISIACWVVVFSPQIIENFRRSSAEGLSIEFVIIWLAGDVFNILGAVLQGVLPTMIILAIYYTVADIVLLGQCFYYRGFTLRDPKPEPKTAAGPTERTPLVSNGNTNGRPANAADIEPSGRNRSGSAFRDRLANLDGTHMSPAVPMHPQQSQSDKVNTSALKPSQPRSWTQAVLFNGTAILLVIVAGVAGYYLSPSSPDPPRHHDRHEATPADDQAQSLQFSLWGQIFGYICAVLYLGSRIPQLLLNYRRKSTEGLNALFFLFACLGNLTYVCSIFAFEPLCSQRSHGHYHESHCRPGEVQAVYGRYILVNTSWLVGSLGTLFLDAGVFAQFWMYRSHLADEEIAPDAVPRTMDGEGRGREPNER